MADDLGYGDIGSYGGWIETPQLDRMAEQGMRFTDYHSNGPVCSPTRAALLTGRYQQRSGLPSVVVADPRAAVHQHGLQPQREITFAELLKQRGYATAIFGKWHLGYYPRYNPIRHGFDEFRGYVSGNIDFFSHVDQAGNFDWWQQDRLEDESGYTTHLITRHALRFIEANRDRPFCLYLPHEAPHYPYQGPDDEPFRKVGQSRVRQRDDVDGRQAYREMVQEMDQGNGQILDALVEHGIEQRTLVVFCSDNGANNRGSNEPLRGSKGQLFEGGHLVPCIAWWPGTIRPGTKNHSLCASMDLMPTILALAGAEPPAGHALDGLDLSPALLEGKQITDREFFWAYGSKRAMRDGQWKLVIDKGSSLLFDLQHDLAEQHNLAAEHPQRFEQMQSQVKAWYQEVTTGATEQPSASPSR